MSLSVNLISPLKMGVNVIPESFFVSGYILEDRKCLTNIRETFFTYIEIVLKLQHVACIQSREGGSAILKRCKCAVLHIEESEVHMWASGLSLYIYNIEKNIATAEFFKSWLFRLHADCPLLQDVPVGWFM
jgi:hypothetical protein